jgi:Xaa-Pro aminopeptidase
MQDKIAESTSTKMATAKPLILPLLMFSESMHNADMYYATRFLSADPFVYLRFPPKKEAKGEEKENDIIIVSQMEYERARRESTADKIRSTLDYGYNIKPEELITKVLHDERVKEIQVPRYFPIYVADVLRNKGINVVTVEEKGVGVMKGRETKTEKEIGFMRKAQRASENAMETAITVIKKSYLKGNMLILRENENPLTAERVKSYIGHALIDFGCTTEEEPIVACGKDAVNPHFSGSGPIFADEPIIIDIFPRLKVERYFADMTRTVVRGKVGKEIKEMYEAVLEAQNVAFSRVKEGVNCRDVHNVVCDVFEARGYDTIRKGSKKGFIHFTGHGVGLDLHENPSVGDNDYVLQRGNVITIEPGLYYPEVGGVRLEDMVVVQKKGCENLTRCDKKLDI